MPLQRRGALSLAASLLTGGCLGGGSDTDCSAGVYVRSRPFAPIDALDSRLDELERTIAADAVESDGTRLTTYQAAPLGEPTLVSLDAAFYRLTRETTDTVEVPAFEFEAEWEEGQSAPDDVETVRFAELPENDRRAFRLPMPEEKAGQFPQSFSVGAYPAPYPDGGEGSRLIGNTSWVVWEDRTVRVEVASEQTGTKERVTYAYTAERVGADAETFQAYLADEYLVDLSGVPEPQLEILRSARGEEGYEECTPQSDALAALRDRLEDEETLPEPYPTG